MTFFEYRAHLTNLYEDQLGLLLTARSLHQEESVALERDYALIRPVVHRMADHDALSAASALHVFY